LREAGAKLVVDVRAIPRSRHNPQFNQDALPSALAAQQIGYEYLAALGGRRGRQPDVSAIVNAFWTNESFHNYADYAMSQGFREGLAKLRQLGHRHPCAIMCAEAVWWRCHRRIIADYLVAADETVLHILGPNQIVPAHLTGTAKLQPSGTLIYPGIS
jgi:uncharacterized protein (DUF488 family)